MNKPTMKKYIEKAGIPAQLRRMFNMSRDDMITIRKAYRVSPGGAITLAFIYGRAKGYRAAMAERGNER